MDLKFKAKSLPECPGCYLMRDAKGAVIYVGKAKNLKNRVISYFQTSTNHTPKTRKLVNVVNDFEVILVQTEVEALLLERTLIKTHDPKYNILLRDDKEYPYIRIGISDPWPRIYRVRKRKDDGALYLGPFGNVSLATSMIHLVFKIFPVIRCSEYEFQAAKRPCNYYHMGQCLGPCKLPVSRETYMATIDDVAEFLKGKTKDVAEKVKRRMMTAATHEEFELAARYRDQLFALEQLEEKQHVIFDGIVDADAISLVRKQGQVSFHVLMVRERHLVGRNSFVVEDFGESENDELMESFLLQYYEARRVPKIIWLEESLNDHDLVAAAIKRSSDLHLKKSKVSHHSLSKSLLTKDKPDREILTSKSQGSPFSILVAKRGVEQKLMDLARKNAEWALEEEFRKVTTQGISLKIVEDELGMELDLETLECIDISNIGGTAIVASCVRFNGGKPNKELYRLYNLADEASHSDDFTSIRKVVRRRLERARRDKDTPATLMIDGGKGQLRAALEIAQEFPDLKFNLISLAKSRPEESSSSKPSYSFERLFFPDREKPINLKVGSHSYRLFTQIRDEAHRFAISHHRKRRSKVRHSSVLDEINGIGSVLKKRLLEEFGSLEQIKDSSLERLMSLPGMTKNRALILKAALTEILDEAGKNKNLN